MSNFAFKGKPVFDEEGNALYVERVKGIEAEDGLVYPGVLAEDEFGNKFTYNQVPSEYIPPVPPVEKNRLIEKNGLFVLDSLDRQIIIVGEDDYVMRYSGEEMDDAIRKAMV